MKDGHSACLTNALSEEPENDPLCHRMMEMNDNDSRRSAAMLAESSGRRFLGLSSTKDPTSDPTASRK